MKPIVKRYATALFATILIVAVLLLVEWAAIHIPAIVMLPVSFTALAVFFKTEKDFASSKKCEA